jgi:hypothetical protein
MFHNKRPLILLLVMIVSCGLISKQSSAIYNAYASKDSLYDHGCDDAGISVPDDKYINQNKKGSSFHTGKFMNGYHDRFRECTGNNGGENDGDYRNNVKDLQPDQRLQTTIELMRASSDDASTALPKGSISTIFSILSDEGCIKILQTISENRQPRVGDLGTRKRYYTRLSKLKKAHLIMKKSKRDAEEGISHQDGYELTDLGSILYSLYLTIRRAESLRVNLGAIDTLDESMPQEEVNKLIEALIPDESIRKFLLKYRHRRLTRD